MRLFTALLPPAEVLDDLAAALAGVADPGGLRWTSREQWHITLGFFGDDDDPGTRTDWLAARATGLPAPELRLSGAGTFPGVLWVAVSETPGPGQGALRVLARAAGADQGERPDAHRDRLAFRPHLTIARARRASGPARQVARALHGYHGPCWRPAEVALVRSEPEGRRHRYTVLARAPLAASA